MDKIKKFYSFDKLLLIVSLVLVPMGYLQLQPQEFKEAFFQDVSAGWQLYQRDGVYLPVTLGDYSKVQSGRYVMVKKSLTREMLQQENLIFYLKDIKILVTFDANEIYRYGNFDPKNSAAKTGCYGANWHLVKIPSYAREGDEIQMTFIPSDPGKVFALPPVYAGTEVDFSSFLMSKNIFSVVNNILLLGFAFVSISFYQIYEKRYHLPMRVRDFGLFILLLFLWFITKNLWIKQVMVDYLDLLNIVSFFAQSMMIVPFIYVFVNTRGFEYEGEALLLVAITWMYLAVRIVLYMLLGIDFYGLSTVDLWFKVVSQLWILVLASLHYYRGKSLELYHILLFGWMFFLFNSADIFMNAIALEHYSSVALESAVMIGVIVIIMDNTKMAIRSYNESIETEHYQKLSTTDAMTGLGNRNWFLSYLKELADLEGLGVVVMDINDLKRVNDQSGHLNGDRLIVATAKLMKEVFGSGFEKFRLGGDEFVIVSRNMPEDALEELVWRFNDEAAKYNETSEIKVQVASGIAVFNPQRDKSIKDVLNRADEQMYLRKITMKI